MVLVVVEDLLQHLVLHDNFHLIKIVVEITYKGSLEKKILSPFPFPTIFALSSTPAAQTNFQKSPPVT